jgi:transaldolase
MQDLASSGISIDKVTDDLTNDGVRLFEEAFDKLLAAIEKVS